MKHVPFLAFASPVLVAWSVHCAAQEAYAFSSLDVTDFIVTAENGTAQPDGPPTGAPGGGIPIGGPNLLNGIIFNNPTTTVVTSLGRLDAPQACLVTPCSVPENTFTPTNGHNFVRTDSLITSLSNFDTGTSVRLVTESRQTPGPSITSWSALNLQQTFTLSQSSQMDISFLAHPLLEGMLTGDNQGKAFAAPSLITEVAIRTESSPASGPFVFNWDWGYNPSGSPTNGTVISNPFRISFNGALCGSPGSVILACGEKGSNRYDPGTGFFKVDTTNPLSAGTYIVNVIFMAQQQTHAAPEPATWRLLALGIGLLAWSRRRVQIFGRA